MAKPKPNSGNKDSRQPAVDQGKQSNRSGQTVSGHPESQGGSRQGNIGHEHAAESGRGDRQV